MHESILFVFFLFRGSPDPGGIYLLKVDNKNTRTRCEIYSKLIIKTPEPCQWRRYDAFIVNFEHISTPCSGGVCIVNFEHVNAG